MPNYNAGVTSRIRGEHLRTCPHYCTPLFGFFVSAQWQPKNLPTPPNQGNL